MTQIERDPKHRPRIHVSADYAKRLLHEDPSFVQYMAPDMTAEEAIKELEKLPPNAVLGCGADDCGRADCPDFKGKA
jgi:hypothetical protein